MNTLILCKVFLIHLLIDVINCNVELPHGEHFLQSMMSKIQVERVKSSLGVLANHLLAESTDSVNAETQSHDTNNLLFNAVPPDQQPPFSLEIPDSAPVHEEVQETPPEHEQQPPLPLSKQEILALYQAALNKANDFNLAQHILPLSDNGDEKVHPENQGTIPGYFYYYYPIKSFMGNGNQQEQQIGEMANMMMQMQMQGQGQGMMMQGAPVKRFEPLFIAMASFVGVAMMFILSILFMPKFGNVRSDVAAVKEVTEESDLSDLSKIVFEAIEGQDCSERLACELGQAIRIMKLGIKPIRAIEIFLPPNLAKQLAQVRKSVNKKERCDFIPCKEKGDNKKPFITINKNPVKINKNHQIVPAEG